MAIGLLFDTKHSFSPGLESLFWVLFWIGIHGNSGRANTKYKRGNYLDTEELAYEKLGIVSDETIFERTVQDGFMDYYKSLIPCILDLRKAVFPGGKLRRKGDKDLYSQILQTTNSSQKDSGVISQGYNKSRILGGGVIMHILILPESTSTWFLCVLASDIKLKLNANVHVINAI